MAADVSVLVVGAGPTGLLLASELHRRGVACRLIDANPAPLHWDRATVVHPRSLEVFESLGLLEGFLAAGVKQRFARLHSEGAVLGEIDLSICGSRYGFNLGLSEEVTETILTGYLQQQGGGIVRSSRLVDMRAAERGLVATIDRDGSSETISTEWIVGCDGLHSATRELSGIELAGHDIPEPWAVFDVTLTNWPEPYEAIYCYMDEPPVILTALPGRLQSRLEAARVCQGQSAPEILDSYEAERRPVAEQIAASGDEVEHAQTLSDPAERRTRDRQLRASFADPRARHHEAIAEAELDIDYGGSPIVMGDAHPALGPGQRLPDTIEVRLASGEQRGLHELTHRAGHTALLVGGASSRDDDLARLADAIQARSDRPLIGATIVLTTRTRNLPPWAWLSPAAADQLGIGEVSLLVVRPDGHVGLRADRDHLDALAAYRSLVAGTASPQRA